MAGKSPKNKRRTVTLNVDAVIIGIDANFEPITKAACDYRQKNVYPYLEVKGFTVQHLQGTMARRTYVAPAARQPNVHYITGLGHGSHESFTGDFYDPVFSVGNYSPEESGGKIVHFLSCETARSLGPDFTLHGCRAYFGYDENFSFQPDTADLFFNCDAEIDRAIADGLSSVEVIQRVRAVFDKHIAELRAQGSNYKAATLEFDRDHLRSPADGNQWGDTSARLGVNGSKKH
jgi:hypothetical protein